MTKVYLFTGRETFNWTFADFDHLANFCMQHDIDGVLLKIYEKTQGEWYKNIGGVTSVIQTIKNVGLDVIPYGYYYGVTPDELSSIQTYLGRYGTYCLDMEDEFNYASDTTLQALIDAIKGKPGRVWISTWANPVTQGWVNNIKKLDPYVDAWLPQIYFPNLLDAFLQQFPPTHAPCYPTYEINNISPVHHAILPIVTLWEYQEAVASPNKLDTFVNVIKGVVTPVSTVINCQKFSEFAPGYTEYGCGPTSVATVAWATQPGTPNRNDPQAAWQWAMHEYMLLNGDNSARSAAGTQDVQMRTLLLDTQKGNTPNPVHYQEITASVDNIVTALKWGYPVICEVTEASVFDDKGLNPYWWGPDGNHTFTIVGYDGQYFLVFDTGAVEKGDGNLQTPKTPLDWPRKYDPHKLVFRGYCAACQLPWNTPIPGPTPTDWKPIDYQLQAANTIWSLAGTDIPLGTGIYKLWLADYRKGIFHGPPVSKEFPLVAWDGTHLVAQVFPSGQYEWNLATSTGKFYAYT